MDIAYLILYGLIAGVLAKTLLPGNDEGGLISTSILGIVGSLIGGVVFKTLGYEMNKGLSFSGLIPAVTGAVILLLLFKILFLKKKSNS